MHIRPGTLSNAAPSIDARSSVDRRSAAGTDVRHEEKCQRREIRRRELEKRAGLDRVAKKKSSDGLPLSHALVGGTQFAELIRSCAQSTSLVSCPVTIMIFVCQ